MSNYRKKPVVIQAVKYTGDNQEEILAFAGQSAMGSAPGSESLLTITTLEGNMKVSEGDFVIKGVKGEFYPCKPDIFEATYDEVEGDVAV